MNYLRKVWTLVRIDWQRWLTYRVSLVSYRVGEIIETLIVIAFWVIIYQSRDVVQGYTRNEMLSYLIIGSVLTCFTQSVFIHQMIWDEVKYGMLSQKIVRPMHPLWQIVLTNSGILTLVMPMVVTTQALLLIPFRGYLLGPPDWFSLVIILVMMILATVFEWLWSILMGLVAFWLIEADATRAFFMPFEQLLNGSYVPLSMIPILQTVGLALPFAYSYFVPMQLYLGKMDLMTGLRGIAVILVWDVVFYIFVGAVWKRGMKKYEGVGT